MALLGRFRGTAGVYFVLILGVLRGAFAFGEKPLKTYNEASPSGQTTQATSQSDGSSTKIQSPNVQPINPPPPGDGGDSCDDCSDCFSCDSGDCGGGSGVGI